MYWVCIIAIWALQRAYLGPWAGPAPDGLPHALHGDSPYRPFPGPLYMGYPIYGVPWIWGIWAMGHMAHSPYTPYAGTTVDGASPWYWAYAYAAPGQPLDLGVAPFGATPDTPYPHMIPQMGHPIQRARA